MGLTGLLVGLLAFTASEPTIATAAGTGQAGNSGEAARRSRPGSTCLSTSRWTSEGILFLGHLQPPCLQGRSRDGADQHGRRRRCGRILWRWRAGHQGPARRPYGIVVGPTGDLFMVDRLNRRVRRVDAGTG